jgi:methyl-accepting chemotaxis protein
MSLLKKVLGFFSNLGSMFIESIVNFRFNSIRTKLIASFLALVFPILVLGIVSNNMAKNSIKELAEGQANSITLATSQYMKLLTENIEEVSLKFLADEDVGDYLSGSSSITEYEVLQLRRSVEAEIQSYTIGGGTISDMLLLTHENRTIKTWGYNGLDLNMEKLLDKEIYQKALETGGRIHWVGYHTDLDESTTTAEIAYSISACRLFKDHNNGKALAILVIDIRNDIITNMLENARITDNSELHLITPDGRDISSRGGTLEESILYSSDFYKNDILTLINNEEEPIEEVITKSKKIKIQGTEYHTVYSILPDSHFTLVALVPIDDIFETSIKYVISLLCLL